MSTCESTEKLTSGERVWVWLIRREWRCYCYCAPSNHPRLEGIDGRMHVVVRLGRQLSKENWLARIGSEEFLVRGSRVVGRV